MLQILMWLQVCNKNPTEPKFHFPFKVLEKQIKYGIYFGTEAAISQIKSEGNLCNQNARDNSQKFFLKSYNILMKCHRCLACFQFNKCHQKKKAVKAAFIIINVIRFHSFMPLKIQKLFWKEYILEEISSISYTSYNLKATTQLISEAVRKTYFQTTTQIPFKLNSTIFSLSILA